MKTELIHKLILKPLSLGGLFLGFSVSAIAQSTPTELADMTLEDLLSFDVIADHTDAEGKSNRWNFAYTYRRLSSGKYQVGTRDVTFDEVLFSPGETRTAQNYPVVPTFICQHVHALSASYAVNESVSLNLVLPYITQGTDHISSVPGFADFLLKSKGIGDISLSASYLKRLSPTAALQFNGGVRVPTGSIDETGDTPRNGSGTLERLPYTMQIGSGTVDLTASFNYSHIVKDLKLGVNAHTTIRTGKNDNDYRLGNNYGVATSMHYIKSSRVQPGFRVNFREIEQIKGADMSLRVPGPFPYPAGITNPSNYGGEKVNVAALVKLCPQTDCKVSFTGEYGVPIYQNLNGVQPSDRRYMSLSASLTF